MVRFSSGWAVWPTPCWPDLMARVMFYPVGLLEQTTFLSRAVALGLGFLVFFLSKRNFFAGTMAATTTFYLLIRFYEGF